VSRRSPLQGVHRELGARLVDFAGWEMPLQFSGVVAEHTAVRERVGLFDVSHLGTVRVRGAGAAEVLDAVVTANVAGIPHGRARYGLVLDDQAGVVDDLFIYARPDEYLVVPNAANTDAVIAAITAAATAFPELVVVDDRERWAILALQGPAARAVADDVLPGANDLPLHGFADLDLTAAGDPSGVAAQVARTGYTGEYGFELFVPAAAAAAVWSRLMEAGAAHAILPVGLGARDTLRLEMGYPLHGHELSPAINPVEAGMSWAVDWSKAAFGGKEALEAIRASGSSRRLAGLVAQGAGIPRAGQGVFEPGGAAAVGEVTSGNFSPTLGRGIALGFVPVAAAEPGTMLEVDVRGRRLPVTVTRPPFVPRGRAATSH
jgi:aminomethyltransferase